MSKHVTAASALDALAAQINEAHSACERSNRESVMHALRAGALLIEAKSQVKHGEWLPWVRANFAGSVRLAQIYMRLAREPEHAQCVAHFGLAGAAVHFAVQDK